MKLFDVIHTSLCNAGFESWRSCGSWWTDFLTPDRLWTVVPALCGTLVGGYVTFAVQSRLKRIEQEAALKERVITFVMTASRIKADMQNVQNMIALYQRENPPDYELWQAVHTLQFTPGFKPELLHLDALSRLKSWKLVTAAMHLYSEYASIIDTISRYNEMRIRYTEMRRDPQRDEAASDKLRENMKMHVNFIKETTLALIREAQAVQRLAFKTSERQFGDAEFLKLQDNIVEEQAGA